jgi:hypothetical protein
MKTWFIALGFLINLACSYSETEPEMLRSLDQIELELIEQKVELLKQRLEYLEK